MVCRLRAHTLAMPRPEGKPKTAFGTRLRALRKSHGVQVHADDRFTAGAFAIELGIETETYRTYERGEHKPPFEILEKIHRATRVSVDWLLFGENPANLQMQAGRKPTEPLRYIRRA